MGLRSLPTLLIQTLDAVTALRPRILKIGTGLTLTDNADGTAGLSRTALAASDIASGVIATPRLGSGVADATTFLRGDQTYAVPAGGGGTPTTLQVTVRNEDVDLTKGTVVMGFPGIGGSTDYPVVLRATHADNVPILGVLAENIASGASGLCQKQGLVSGFDTSGVSSVGDVYAAAAGALSNSPGTFAKYVGFVTVKNASTGAVFVLPQQTKVIAHGHFSPTTGGDLSYAVIDDAIQVYEVAGPGTPDAGSQYLFIDPADHHLKRANSSSVTTDIERSASTAAYTTGTDQTGSRALNTNYTNSSLRRRVHATVDCVATIANAATIGGKTTVGGTALNLSDQAGAPSGIIQSDRAQLNFEVDPGATYGVNSSTGGSSTATLVRWIEVDE